MPTRLLVGLGNPGSEYADTRHNLGFVCLDAVAAELPNVSWKEFKGGLLAHVALSSTTKVLLLKPMQYMNNSGIQTRAVIDYFNLEAEDIAVVLDDVYVKPGSGRVRNGGGDGGHNGLKSLIDHLDPDTFWRVKIGAGLYEQGRGERHHLPPLEEYVLQKLPKHDEKKVQALIDRLVPDLVQWLHHGTGFSNQTIHS